MTSITKIKELELQALEGLRAESLQEGYRFIQRLCDEWISGANRFSAPGEALFLAIADGRVVGVCGLNCDPYRHDPRTGRVRRLYVSRAHRRSGVGRALLEAVVAYAFSASPVGKAASHPEQSMTWYDCVKWCNARSEMEGRVPAYYTDATWGTVYRTGSIDLTNACMVWNAGYRLPTEAEWEAAARGGVAGDLFPWGNTINESEANYYSDGKYTYDQSDTGYNTTYNDGVQPYTSPVGSFVANGYGLSDMAGNVWQWCWDWFGSYSSASQTDPRGPTSGSIRVYRGGSWYYDTWGCRVAFRVYYYPYGRGGSMGFRW